jgi:hypothetical protein
MSSILKGLMQVAVVLILTVVAAFPANNAEQVIFTTPGSVMDLSNGGSTPFGFWIWCAAEASPRSNGGYQNANACQGNMYFYLLDHNAKPIIGQVGEGADGVYTMNVVEGTFAQFQHGTLDPDFVCSLTNPSPTPTHTVTVGCVFPALGLTGTATVTNTTVNVTGKK